MYAEYLALTVGVTADGDYRVHILRMGPSDPHVRTVLLDTASGHGHGPEALLETLREHAGDLTLGDCW